MIYLVFPNTVDKVPYESLRRKISSWGMGCKVWLQNRRQLSLREQRSASFKEEKMLAE